MTNTDTGLQLRRYIENIERLEEDRKGISDTILDTYKEAKAAGFDTKTIRKIIKLRKIDEDKRQEEEYLLKTYEDALKL